MSKRSHSDQFVTVETMVSHRDKGPRVVLAIAAEGVEPTSLQLSPAKAKEIGTWLIEAAESATVESMVVRFLMAKLDVPEDLAGAVLNDFRKFREEAISGQG